MGSTGSVLFTELREEAAWVNDVAARASAEASLATVTTHKPKRNRSRLNATTPEAVRAIDGSGGCTNTSDESPERSRKAVMPYKLLVLATIAKVVKGEKKPTKAITF